MQRSTRFNRPGLKGSSKDSLLFSSGDQFILKAGPDTTTSTSLSWQASGRPDNYRVERSLDGLSFSTVATVSDSTLDYNDTGLTESTQYWYRIVPILGGVDQPASNVADTWTVPSTPTTLTATAVGGTQIDLTWVDVSTGNTAQIIERRTPSGSGSYSLLATVGATATTYSDTGLTPGQSYEYRVAATNPATLSAYSNTASATPSATPTAAWTLDFSSGEPWANGTNYTFSSTASTSRTFVNSSGFVAPCVANLLLRSEDFTTTWTNTNTTEPTTNNTAPDGTATADEIAEVAATTVARNIQQGSISLTNGQAYTFTVYAKAGSATAIQLIGANTGFGLNEWANFDISAGTVGSVGTAVTGSDATIDSVGNGWYRCKLTMVATATTSSGIVIALTNNNTSATRSPTYTVTAGNEKSFYAWGAQLVTGSDALPYSATTTSTNGIPRLTHNSSGSRLGLLVEEQRTNLVVNSENMSAFAATGISITSNTDTAPDNTLSADKITETSGTTVHALRGGLLTASAQTYTASGYLKNPSSGGRGYGFIGLIATGGGDTAYCAVVNLTNGQFETSFAGGSPSASYTITDVGNGWYRVSVTATAPSGTTNVRWRAGMWRSGAVNGAGTNIGQPDYNAPSGSEQSILVWGAQLEQGSASSYIPTTTASVTRQADLAHVLDSTITGWQDPGALVVHFYKPGAAGNVIFSTENAANQQLGIEETAAGGKYQAFWSSGSTSDRTGTSGVQKAVHYWNGTNSRFCLNSGTVQTGTNNITTFGDIDFLTLAATATDSAGVPGTYSRHSNAIIRKVEFYSGTLTDAQLQAITT